MGQESWNRGGTISVKQILELYPKLGLPHFQRGRVWGNDSISALLESLFFNTPCGSFVFWNSRDNAEYGVPIDSAATGMPDYLVIDGQQRIRSLHDAWKDVQSNDEDDPRPRVWCVNLSRVPRLERYLEQSRKTPTIFVWAQDPAVATPESAKRTNFIPLKEIRARATWADLSAYHGLIRTRDKAQQDLWRASIDNEYLELRRQILDMQKREFFVAHRDAQNSLAAMAELYNRINAGGKQVETEERAFAALVGLQPGNAEVSDGLRRAFVAVHGASRPTDDRDALMKREQERQFGFKLFIRIFLQVCQYHLGQGTGKSSFSFDPVGRDAFRDAFSQLQGPDVQTLWDETLRVTQTLREVLNDQLNCDDLRMLPDATAFLPVAQLLIQYPTLAEARYRPLLASLVLRTALAKAETREWAEWMEKAGDVTSNALQTIHVLHQAVAPKARDRFAAAMKAEASSLQDRYVLLLYWLQRQLKASDLSCECIPEEKSRPAGPAAALSKDVKAEKGHVIPRSRLAKVYGVDVRPTETHEINSIGNLTYMSYVFNRALGDDFPALSVEMSGARRNLTGHLIANDDSQEFFDGYETLKRLMLNLPDSDEETDERRTDNIIKRFKKLTQIRRQAIQQAVEQWIREIDSAALKELGVNSWDDLASARTGEHRLEPQKPKFAAETQVAHFVRGLGLPDDAEDHVLALIRQVRRRPDVKDDVVSIQLTRLKRVTVEVRRSGVTLRLDHLNERLRAGALKSLGLGEVAGREIALAQVPRFDELVRFCDSHEADFTAADVEAGKAEKDRPTQRRARISSESAYWALIQNYAPEAEPLVRQLVEPLRSSFQFDTGASSLKVRFIPADAAKWVPMFHVKKRGELEFWPNTFTRRAKEAGISASVADEYVVGMRRLLNKGSGEDCFSRIQEADVPALQALVLGFLSQAARGTDA